MDRLFWVALSRLWRGWRSTFVLVKPERLWLGIVGGFAGFGLGRFDRDSADARSAVRFEI
jgi:hypothetical protein